MSDYFEIYKRRVLANGETIKEMEENRGKRNFEYMLTNKTSPTVHSVVVNLNNEKSDTMTNKIINCEISNVTRNDQDKYDEKYIRFSLDENITYGSYVKWRKANWLILFEENSTFEIYQMFTMRRCNNIFNFKFKGQLYQIPQVVKNLTLYSDGLDDEIYISKPDAQRQIMMADNGLTDKIKVGTRVMLTNSTVYQITHIDDFSHPGVRTMICKETTLNSLDDLENNIAYNVDSETPITPPINVEIIGNDFIYLSDFITFKTNGTSDYTWKVTSDMVKITYQDSKTCDVECSGNIKNINKTFRLEMYEKDMLIALKEIIIKGMN